MAICTFFGHRDAPESIRTKLHILLIDLIENKNVTRFYVGNQGRFDSMVLKELNELKKCYPYLDCFVVLAYMPGKKTDDLFFKNINTIYPDGLETTPPRYAISRRNRWMVLNADYVVTYVIYSFGGAVQWKELAEKKGKIVYNLVD
jgi:hypothetical protein